MLKVDRHNYVKVGQGTEEVPDQAQATSGERVRNAVLSIGHNQAPGVLATDSHAGVRRELDAC